MTFFFGVQVLDSLLVAYIVIWRSVEEVAVILAIQYDGYQIREIEHDAYLHKLGYYVACMLVHYESDYRR